MVLLRSSWDIDEKGRPTFSGPEGFFWGVQGRKATRGSSRDQNTDFAIASKSQ